jgi:hypothetical protein
MKKFLVLAITLIFTLFLNGCEDDTFDGTISVTVRNNSNYILKGVQFFDLSFGDMISGGSSIRKLSHATMQYARVTFTITTNDGDKEFITKDGRDVYYGTEAYEFTINNGTLVKIKTENDNPHWESGYFGENYDTIQSFAAVVKNAALTINNMSDFNLYNVEYDGVDFGTINSGGNSNKPVNDGTKFVFFNLRINSTDYRCRTEAFTCETGSNTLTITNNTLVTNTVNYESDTLRNIYLSLSD